MRAFHHLHVLGDFVDRHGPAIHAIGAVLAVAAALSLLWPLWLRFGGRS